MKQKILKILAIILWCGIFAGIAVSLGFISIEQDKVLCKAIIVNIDRKNENYFIEEEDIKEIIFNKGDSLIGTPVSRINIAGLERSVKNNPSVENAEVYTTIDGVLKIEVVQRRPVVRIYNLTGDSYYIDEHGKPMPLSVNYAARVPVANGNIKENYPLVCRLSMNSLSKEQADTTILDEIFTLTSYIDKDEFLKVQIEQIFINEENEIVLIPRVGNHKIIFGDITAMEEKFKKLRLFYEKGLNNVGWNNYSIINLKFKNQVVCTKKEIKV